MRTVGLALLCLCLLGGVWQAALLVRAQGTQMETFLPLVVRAKGASPTPTRSPTPTPTRTVSVTPTQPTNPNAVGRTVNAPYFNRYSYPAMTLFWLGKVNATDVYGDVRVGYDDTTLYFSVNMIDRLLWYDTSPALADLYRWDAVSLYLSADDTPGGSLTAQQTRWLAQLANTSNRADYQASYRGNGSSWQVTSQPFETEVRFQGDVNGGGSGKGWSVNYRIPWSSLGYDAPPPQGTQFRLGVALHDRDSADGPPRADTVWPETMNALLPNTWGWLHWGALAHQPPPGEPDGMTVIRNGQAGAVVADAHVGGAFDCGESVQQDWDAWGNKNYEAINDTQVNIQNQWNIDDWPCFSRYYITFPLSSIPANADVVSATLTLYHYGNSDPANAEASNIHAFIIRESWNDTTITWNNAPLAWMNISRLRVEPLPAYPGWPGIPLTWDVSLALLDALAADTPLRLAFYSSDYAMHSGKYFHSSDVGLGDPNARPYLTVYWQNP